MNIEIKSLIHLQTEFPAMSWEDWYVETVKLFAKAESIDLAMMARKLNTDILEEWYEDGFTPYVTFRENYAK